MHALIQLRSARRQYIGTHFFRNRPELELLVQLLAGKPAGSVLDMAIVACSKGAEVYSMAYAIRCERPDLKLRLRAVDIAEDVLNFAEAGVYSLGSDTVSGTPAKGFDPSNEAQVALLTGRDQPLSIFDRISPEEMAAMFDQDGDEVTVKPQFRVGMSWHLLDARDQILIDALGHQDIVVANRFLCHMQPAEAEACLRNLAGLVKPGGYLFVSGVDLEVRAKVARELDWRPVEDLIREIHEGDPSLRLGWPLEYWGLEPFQEGRRDWMIRYASVFRVGGRSTADATSTASVPGTSSLLNSLPAAIYESPHR